MKIPKCSHLIFCFSITIVFGLGFCNISEVYSQSVFVTGLTNGNNYEKASFRLWVNDNVQTIRGVIVMVPGSNSDGREMVNDSLWQKIALRHGFALVGCYFTDKNHPHMEIEEYANAGRGRGQAGVNQVKFF